MLQVWWEFPKCWCIINDVAISKIMKINYINIICTLYVFLVLQSSKNNWLVPGQLFIFWGRSNEYQEFVGTYWLLSRSGSATLKQLNPIKKKGGHFFFFFFKKVTCHLSVQLLLFTNIHRLNDWKNISDWIQNNKLLIDRFGIRNIVYGCSQPVTSGKLFKDIISILL